MRRAHNPPVVGSIPTRPTTRSVQGYIARPRPLSTRIESGPHLVGPAGEPRHALLDPATTVPGNAQTVTVSRTRRIFVLAFPTTFMIVVPD